MSAHYKPYKNEPDAEQLNWTSEQDMDNGDSEAESVGPRLGVRRPGDWSARALFIGGVLLALLGIVLGLSVGFFAARSTNLLGDAICEGHLRLDIESRLQNEEAHRVRKLLFNTIDSESIRGYLRRFSRRARVSGTSGAWSQAAELRDSWTALGVDRVDVATYSPLLSFPDPSKPNSVRLVDTTDGRQVFLAQVRETPTDSPDVTTAYAAYSPPGDVKADVVYCNYGQPSDFAVLSDKFNLNLTGKILLMRLGMMHIGDQVQSAERLGAVGILLYPDPQDFTPYGPSAGAFPSSWWLPGNAIPHGTAINVPDGDPLTPGYPATDFSFRLPLKNAKSLPKVPVQMISYDDAYHIVSLIGGRKAPQAWQGGFNFTYNVGPGLTQTNWTVHLEVHNSNKIQRIFNVIGYIKGRTEPDRYVIVGNHRDAWVYGAADPASGTAVITEVIRAFGRLSKQGWRPRRTLLFCSWDAEEFNLIGSTEWLEEHMGILQGRAVAYVNLDAAVTGNHSLSASSSPLLYQTVYRAAQQVPNPGRHSEGTNNEKTVYDTWVRAFPNNRNSSAYFLRTVLDGSNRLDFAHLPRSEFLREALENTRPRMKRLHGRTDYSGFFNQAGIPAVELSYAYILPGAYPLYHTAFDNFYAVENFIDPTFKYHEAVARVVGEVVRDLSDSIFIPFNVLYYTKVMKDMYQTLQLRYDLIPQFKRDMEHHGIRIGWLEQAVQNFSQAALDFHLRQESLEIMDPLTIRSVNDQLMLLERAFLDNTGLPGQPRHRHIVLGPSRAHTFGDESFPGLVDLLTEFAHPNEEHWMEVRRHLSALVFVIQSATNTLADVM